MFVTFKYLGGTQIAQHKRSKPGFVTGMFTAGNFFCFGTWETYWHKFESTKLLTFENHVDAFNESGIESSPIRTLFWFLTAENRK